MLRNLKQVRCYFYLFRDWFYELSNDLTVDQSLNWKITPAEFAVCNDTVVGKGRLSRIDYECGNHIRVYRKFPDVPAFSDAQGRMLVCGSYGLDPRCITVDIVSICRHADIEGWAGLCLVTATTLSKRWHSCLVMVVVKLQL